MPFFASDPDVVVAGEGGEGTPGRVGDICPQGWEESADRAQMTTQVFIGRVLPSDMPEFNYTLAVVATPAAGQVDFNPDAQLGTVTMQVHRTTADAVDAYTWLQYIRDRCTLRLYRPADPKITLTYTVVGTPTFNGTVFQFPVVWTEGEGEGGAPITPGPLRMAVTLVSEPPQLWEDTLGKSIYGPQPLQRTDLINTSTALFGTLADRILEVRGVNSVPRLEAVTIDARTGHGIANMDLMSQAAPEKPSRYAMRLAVDERPIYDRMCFVAGIRHFISRDEWTLRISLDIAEWAGQL